MLLRLHRRRFATARAEGRHRHTLAALLGLLPLQPASLLPRLYLCLVGISCHVPRSVGRTQLPTCICSADTCAGSAVSVLSLAVLNCAYC